MSRVKVVGVQVSPTDDKRENLKKAVKLIDEAMRSHCQSDIICLPELFYRIPFPPENAHKVAESIPYWVPTVTAARIFEILCRPTSFVLTANAALFRIVTVNADPPRSALSTTAPTSADA